MNKKIASILILTCVGLFFLIVGNGLLINLNTWSSNFITRVLCIVFADFCVAIGALLFTTAGAHLNDA